MVEKYNLLTGYCTASMHVIYTSSSSNILYSILKYILYVKMLHNVLDVLYSMLYICGNLPVPSGYKTCPAPACALLHRQLPGAQAHTLPLQSPPVQI